MVIPRFKYYNTDLYPKIIAINFSELVSLTVLYPRLLVSHGLSSLIQFLSSGDHSYVLFFIYLILLDIKPNLILFQCTGLILFDDTWRMIILDILNSLSNSSYIKISISFINENILLLYLINMMSETKSFDYN